MVLMVLMVLMVSMVGGERHRVEVRGGGGPEAEVRDANRRAAAAERRGDGVAAVEDERCVEVGLREARGLDLDRAVADVAGADAERAVVEHERDAVVEAAVQVEVVVGLREREARLVEAVAERGEERVLAGRERAGREPERRIGQRAFADGAAVEGKRADEAHAGDLEPRGGDVAIEAERAPVERGAALEVLVGHRVPAARDDHRSGRRERGVGGLREGLALFEPEGPAAVEGERGEGCRGPGGGGGRGGIRVFHRGVLRGVEF